jgi:regulatory protein YycH of two-component signal transduction system YycFG
MGKPKQIEAIKNVILVVLFFSTMLLLYFFWENPMVESFNISRMIGEDEIAEAPSIQDVTRPQETVVHLGGGIYTKLNEGEYDAWNQFILACNQFGKDESLVVEEIAKEQYNKIMEFRSIQYDFQYDIPFSSLCSLYQMTKVQSFDQIETASVMGYSTGSPESLFVYDGRNNKYYRLVSEVQETGLNNMITQIETGGYVTYYSIGTLVGTTNQNVLPLSIETNLGEVPYSPELDIRKEEGIIEFAQTFFGESFDFIRRIEESKGSIIYMYGYGERILTINADGSIEYKERMNSSGSQQDYFASLEAALQFVASHGTWETFDGNCSQTFRETSEIHRKR